MKSRKKRKTPAKAHPLPTVDLSQPHAALFGEIGMILRRKGAPIFLMEGEIVTVSRRGKVEPMTAERFPKWIEKYMTFTLPGNHHESPQPATGKMAYAALILPS